MIARRARAVDRLAFYALEATIDSTCNFEREMTIYLPSRGHGPIPLAHPPGASRVALRAPLHRAARQKAKLLRRIERAVSNGDAGKAVGLQRLFLKSHSAKLCSAAKVNKTLKSAERAKSNELVAIAERIAPFRANTEPVHVHAATKANGGWRPLTVFGLERAALQDMACAAMRPFHRPDPRQYAISGGGHNEAARMVRQGLVDGYTWFVGLDITSFYSTIERDKIHDLIPLPDRIVDHIILPPPIEHVRIGNIGHALAGVRLAEASQSGISQGSRSSPLIAEVIVKQILTRFALDVRIINVADDFGVLARSKRDADAIQSALTRASSRSPAGCFHLRSKVHSGPRRVCDGFEFVGYRFRKRRSHILSDASDTNFQKFNNRVLDITAMIELGRPDAICRLRRYVKQWWRSFPLMNGHCRQGDFFFARHHTSEVVRMHRPRMVTLVNLAMDWDGADYTPLLPREDIACIARAIRASKPIWRSRVPHWK